MMAHEQSETVERDGRFYNVYGRGTPKAGQVLPGTGAFNTLNEAVTAAKARSESFNPVTYGTRGGGAAVQPPLASGMEEVDVQVGNEILTLEVPQGTSDDVIMQQARVLAAQPQPEPLPSGRETIRAGVEALPQPLRFAVESGPAIAGTAVGGALGAATPVPGGALIGGAAGGLTGEAFAQRVGLAPESTTGKVLAGAGPLAAPVIAKGVQMGAGAVSRVPGVSQAIKATRVEEAATKLLDYGADILARASARPGLAGYASSSLEQQMRATGAKVFGHVDLPNTDRALYELRKAIRPYAKLKEGKQVSNVIDSVRKNLRVGQDTEIPIKDFVEVQKRILDELPPDKGKVLYDAMIRDIDTLSQRAGKVGQAAKLAKAATERRALESSVGQFDELIRANRKVLENTGNEVVNLSAVQKRLLDLTDPKSAKYNADFAKSLGSELPEIQRFLTENSKYLSDKMGPGGGLVVRAATAKGARTILGFVTGGLLGGATGGILGGIAGAQAPERLTSLMLTPGGREVLKKLIRTNQGNIPIEQLALASQAATQAVSRESGRETLRNIGERPLRGMIPERYTPYLSALPK